MERPAAEADHLVVDYVGSIDGEPFEGGAARDQLLELGSGRLIPGFEEQLLGAAAGQERAVEVTFPDDYPEQTLAGQPARFDVTVHEVRAKQLPELDDDFAATAGGFDSVEELRADIASRMEKAEEAAIEREFEEAVLDAAVDQATVDVPGQLVHAKAHELLEDTLGALARQGISKEAYLRIAGKDEETLAHEAEPSASGRPQARGRPERRSSTPSRSEPSDEEVREALEPTAAGGPAKNVDALFDRS